MKLILIEPVDSLGLPGDVVNVKTGFARNYLLPAGKALPATDGKVAELEHVKRIAEGRRKKFVKSLEGRRDQMAGARIAFTEKAHAGNKLYGSINARRIADALAEKFGDVLSSWVVLAEPIKLVGEYNVELRLAPDVTTRITVEVIGELDDEPAVEAAAAGADGETPAGDGAEGADESDEDEE